MMAEWFNEIVDDWGSQLAWTGKERAALQEHLMDIAIQNGGLVAWDIEVDNALALRFALLQACEALAARMSFLAKAERGETWPGTYTRPSARFNIDDPLFEGAESVERVDLNAATEVELAGLPGIGDKTAARIVASRTVEGEFRQVEDVKRVRGIGQKELDRFANAVFVSQPVNRRMFSNNQLAEFVSRPTFKGYISLLAAGNYLGSMARAAPSIKSEILKELMRTRQWLEAFRDSDRRRLKTRASSAQAKLKRAAAFDQLVGSSLAAEYVSVASRSYADLVVSLLQASSSAVRVAMFFFAYDTKGTHPTEQFLGGLIAAQTRGADVAVLLDRDDDDDPYGSRTVNRAAFNALQTAGVRVRFDRRDRLLHSKVLVVDGKHVILGSHNWTAGSLFQYEDLSVYVRSEALAKCYEEWFESVWEESCLSIDVGFAQ